MMVKLPGGYWRDGTCIRQVALRGLTGRDELWLAEAADGLPRARVVSELLERCVENVPAGELTAGDREALLLQLRSLSFGDNVPATLECPACEERMDVELTSSALLTGGYAQSASMHEAAIHFADQTRRVAFRLPTGADQEAAAALSDPAAGARLILKRCVVEVDPPLAVEDWPAEAIAQIDERMAALDPQAELRLSLRCPACQTLVETIFDTGAYLLAELAMRRNSLLAEVHLLASNYHWSEAEILGLSRTRRQVYLEMITSPMEARHPA